MIHNIAEFKAKICGMIFWSEVDEGVFMWDLDYMPVWFIDFVLRDFLKILKFLYGLIKPFKVKVHFINLKNETILMYIVHLFFNGLNFRVCL